MIDYINPGDPEAKPPAVQKVTTVLPKGARFNVRVPDSCTAGDAALLLEGGAACPASSRVGGGVVTVDTGFPEPARTITADVDLFNNATDPEGEFIYVNTVRGVGARTLIRADIVGRDTVTISGALPGTPPDGGAIDTVDLTVDKITGMLEGVGRRAYLTTPRNCPKRGEWHTRIEFSYPDGVAETIRSETPCRRKR